MARVAVEWAAAAQVHDACTSMILDHKGDATDDIGLIQPIGIEQ